MTNNIHLAPLRQTVQAQFPDGRAFDGPQGTTIEAFIKAAQPTTTAPIVAALRNGQLRELSREVDADAELVPVTLNHSDGMRIYRRSLTFLLIAAAAEVRGHLRVTRIL